MRTLGSGYVTSLGAGAPFFPCGSPVSSWLRLPCVCRAGGERCLRILAVTDVHGASSWCSCTGSVLESASSAHRTRRSAAPHRAVVPAVRPVPCPACPCCSHSKRCRLLFRNDPLPVVLPIQTEGLQLYTDCCWAEYSSKYMQLAVVYSNIKA